MNTSPFHQQEEIFLHISLAIVLSVLLQQLVGHEKLIRWKYSLASDIFITLKAAVVITTKKN